MIGGMEIKFQRAVAEKVFTLAMFAVLLGLGTWQVKRLVWKTELLATMERQMQKPPVPLPETIDNPGDWEYRRVTLAGRFLYEHEFLVKPRTLDGVNGYHMVVPFQRASGGVVMVNRGWISDALMSEADRPQGIIQIEGIVQRAHPTAFTPRNNPARNDWYWADIGAMAMAAQLQNPSPVLVAIATKERGVYPVGGKVQTNLRNDHLQYAIFWYTMAAVMLIMYLMRHLDISRVWRRP